MRYVKFVMMALAAIGVVLGFVYNLLSAGGQGIFTLAMCATPLALGIVSEASKKGFPRWMGGVSLAALLITGMKTSGDDSDLNNIMMAAFFGMICALVLTIKPEKA